MELYGRGNAILLEIYGRLVYALCVAARLASNGNVVVRPKDL